MATDDLDVGRLRPSDVEQAEAEMRRLRSKQEPEALTTAGWESFLVFEKGQKNVGVFFWDYCLLFFFF